MRSFKFMAALAVVLVAGCSPQDTDKVTADAKGAAQDASQAIGGLTLVGKVQTALRLRKNIDASQIHVEAKDGTVTLTGHVKSLGEKSTVFDVVTNTTGVDKLIDQDLTVDN